MDDSMDLNDFDIPARILPAQYSQTEALVGVGNKKLKRISVPEDTQLALHFVTINYLHSVEFKKLAASTRKSTVYDIELFFNFITKNNYLVDSDVPQKVFEEFVQYLRKNTNQKSNTIARTINMAKGPLVWYLENNGKTTQRNNYSQVIRQYIVHCPDFQTTPKTPYPSLATLFEGCPYSDTEIMKSLRLVCCWLLLECDRHRIILLDDSKVKTILEQLKHSDITNPPVSHATFASDNKKLNAECRSHYFPIVKAVLDSKDLVLMERLLESIKHPFSSVMSSEDMSLVLNKVLSSTREVAKEFRYQGKKYQSSSITSITYRDLQAPSLVEVFAAQCFLASERIQRSNLDRLKLTDITKNDNGMQAQHVKGRRSEKRKLGITAVYPQEQLIHDALTGYIYAVEQCQSLIAKEDKGLALPYLYNFNLKNGYLGIGGNVVSQHINLLLTDGTHTQKALFKDVSEKDVQPFLWIARKIYENNNKANKQLRLYSRKLHEAKINGEIIQRSDFVTSKVIGLNPTYIGQSRVAMDAGIVMQEKGVSEPTGYSDAKTEAQLTAHSPETKHNTYHDRSNSKEVIESRRKFAVQMGDLMVKDAAKMGVLMKNTEVLSLEEAKKILGCANASEDFKSLINELDEDIGLTSEIITDDKTIFVANELTAALIILKVLHIEQHLPRMLMDDPDSQAKAKRAIGEKVYLQAVLDRFPEDIQVAGKAMSKNLTFSFSDLI